MVEKRWILVEIWLEYDVGSMLKNVGFWLKNGWNMVRVRRRLDVEKRWISVGMWSGIGWNTLNYCCKVVEKWLKNVGLWLKNGWNMVRVRRRLDVEKRRRTDLQIQPFFNGYPTSGSNVGTTSRRRQMFTGKVINYDPTGKTNYPLWNFPTDRSH